MVLPTPDRYLKQTCENCGATYISHQPTDALHSMVTRCKKCGRAGFEYSFFTRPQSSLMRRLRRLFT